MSSSKSSSHFQKDSLRDTIRFYHAIGNHRTSSDNLPTTIKNANENKSQRSQLTASGKWVRSSQRIASTQYGAVLDLGILVSSTPSPSSTNQMNQSKVEQDSNNKNAVLYQGMPSSKMGSRSQASQDKSQGISSNKETPQETQAVKRTQGYEAVPAHFQSNGTISIWNQIINSFSIAVPSNCFTTNAYEKSNELRRVSYGSRSGT